MYLTCKFSSHLDHSCQWCFPRSTLTYVLIVYKFDKAVDRKRDKKEICEEFEI